VVTGVITNDNLLSLPRLFLIRESTRLFPCSSSRYYRTSPGLLCKKTGLRYLTMVGITVTSSSLRQKPTILAATHMSRCWNIRPLSPRAVQENPLPTRSRYPSLVSILTVFILLLVLGQGRFNPTSIFAASEKLGLLTTLCFIPYPDRCLSEMGDLITARIIMLWEVLVLGEGRQTGAVDCLEDIGVRLWDGDYF